VAGTSTGYWNNRRIKAEEIRAKLGALEQGLWFNHLCHFALNFLVFSHKVISSTELKLVITGQNNQKAAQ
jgi:hypothetical protein